MLLVALLVLIPLTACTGLDSTRSESGLMTQELGGAGQAEELEKFSYSFTSSFDTAITIIGYSDSQASFDRLAHAAEDRFVELHQLFDIYHEYPGINNLMTVNRMAGQGPIRVAPEIIDLMAFYRDSDALAPGKVNAALGAVLSIWHDHRDAAESGQGTLPDLAGLKAAAAHVDAQNLIIDREASTLELKDPRMRLDVGAVGKGFATELVARELIEQGLESGIISAGGSNVRLIGKPAEPSRETWAIGIQNPFVSSLIPMDDPPLDVIEVNDRSIVTSGDYQRYYLVDGVAYHHLIDPVTLMPANHVKAVTIMTADSGLADFLSTAIFLMPYEEGRRLVDRLEDVEALWVLQDGTVEATAGMKSVLKFQGQANARESAIE
jgi:thiamine biosynthesis lipoprotein